MSDEFNLTAMIEAAFDRAALKRICELPEAAFAKIYDMATIEVQQREPANYYYFKDNGSDILAVAHLDTVVNSWQRTTGFIDTAAGTVVHSGALDDRLGAYIILDLLPKLGVTCDILLTLGEESGMSTAQFFDPDYHDKVSYNWIIEFDRGGTDVVLYEYGEGDSGRAAEALVKASGARVSVGIFSDICYLEQVGVKAFNWGVGYQDYHSTRGYAYIDDTLMMVEHFLRFYVVNAETRLPHEARSYGRHWWDDERYERQYPRWTKTCEVCEAKDTVDLDTGWCDACESCNDCWNDQGECVCPTNRTLVERMHRDPNDEEPLTEEEAAAALKALDEAEGDRLWT